jgi:hypothetical protein
VPKNPFEGIPKIPQIPTGQERQCVELQEALVALKVVDEECSTIRGDEIGLKRMAPPSRRLRHRLQGTGSPVFAEKF